MAVGDGDGDGRGVAVLGGNDLNLSEVRLRVLWGKGEIGWWVDGAAVEATTNIGYCYAGNYLGR